MDELPIVTQADIDLCVDLNIPEYEAPKIARHRIASNTEAADLISGLLAKLESPTPELIEAAVVAYRIAPIDDRASVFTNHRVAMAAALAATAAHIRALAKATQ